jgi:hypothetical protein
MPSPLTKADAAYLAFFFALAALAAGVGAEEVVAGATAVVVGIWLLTSGRPPFANQRIPPASAVVAWSLAAAMSGALALAGAAWGFAMLSAAAAASAGALWRRRRAAKRRGLV